MSKKSIPSIHRSIQHWDIFCRVIDNFGDAGVCWRLSKQLADEYGLKVHLWIDDITALKPILPTCTLAEFQIIENVQIHIWRDDSYIDSVADVVIEAFACHLSDNYVAQMKSAKKFIHWLNLEYLSAESWVEGCHRLTSVHPQTGLKKTFFFPGFSEATGGLIREKNLIQTRNEFVKGVHKLTFLTDLGIQNETAEAIFISLFSYENESIASLIRSWKLSEKPIICVVTEGKTLVTINRMLNLNLAPGDQYQMRALTLIVIPFLSQIDYDRLLWSCDINFVRGEDSFVRAQWAGKPFVWHIYPQEDGAHFNKLRAFTDRYTQSAPALLKAAIETLFEHWNRGEDCGEAWQNVMRHGHLWGKHSREWCNYLCSKPDLAANLVLFCQKAL